MKFNVKSNFMMRLFLIQVLFCCLCPTLFAQNLVQNPSFEQLKPNAVVVACEFMGYTGRFTECAEIWTTFKDMTPDVLRAAENCSFLPQVHSGEFCGGIIYYLPAVDSGIKGGYREAIQGKLIRPMKPGQRYQVSFWVKEDPALMQAHMKKVYVDKTPVRPVHANNLGFYFSITPFNNQYPLDYQLQGTNQKPQVNFAQIISTRGQWIQLSTTFVADQPFMYFILGNTLPESQTITDISAAEFHKIDSINAKIPAALDKIKRVAYVCIDDISISPVQAPNVDTMPMSLENRILKDRKFTFSAELLFDSGKSDLRPAATPQLDSLTAFLVKYPRNRLGISGHTDNVGSEEYNHNLSGLRAQSVHKYLIDKGIPATQIEWKAFGESKPVADNDTESGRQKNRRVECVLLK